MRQTSLFLIISFSLIASGTLLALEPLKEAGDAYMATATQRFLARYDTDRDGTFQKSEDERIWPRYRKLDKNADKSLDAEELNQMPLKYVGSEGKQMRNVLYKKVGTKRLYLDIYFPEPNESTEKPVVIYTHGGGWAAGSKHGAGNASFDVVHQELLENGFCVAAVNYRLCRKGSGVTMRDCVIDCKDAIRFLSAHRKALGIDPTRIYTFGDSAGGHLAQILLLSPPESLAGDPDLAQYSYKTVAGVSWYGPCDFEKTELFNHDDRPDFTDRFGARIVKPGVDADEKLKLYREVSPINYLTEKSPPLLMIQGNRDTTIPVKHAYHMQKVAEPIKAPVEIMIIKNAGHNWRKVDADIEPSREEIISRTVQFLVDHQ